MTKVIIALICTALFALTMSANTRMTTVAKDMGAMTTANSQDSSSNVMGSVDMDTIMSTCNESFRIEMGYLEALNSSGSFTDEVDRTPKCYLRCVLENIGVMSPDDGTFNPARAAVIYAGERNGKPMDDIADMTAVCADRSESCRCERAYKFMRCLMSMEIEKYENSPP